MSNPLIVTAHVERHLYALRAIDALTAAELDGVMHEARCLLEERERVVIANHDADVT